MLLPILQRAAKNLLCRSGVVVAQEANISAGKDIIGSVPPYDIQTLGKVLHAIRAGTSGDDASVLRDAVLRKPNAKSCKDGPVPDDILSENWRNGGDPYQHLMSRKAYEKQKYRRSLDCREV